ncbi:LysM peptidoglycan-binding domain-containing protein [Sphingobacterium sp. Mn56C]|uniref:lytic transglycosylase domain-containing protein n=1 Tax=Sphingobacterium sp. Mn56C TaxID=3395261 RepID=UPI003BBB4AAE
MRFPIYLSFVAVLTFSSVKAQEIAIDRNKEELNSSLISIIEIQKRQLSADLDSIKENVDPRLEVAPEDIGILRRMRAVTKDIPLDFNSQVKSYIEKYTSQNYRPYMNRLLGLSRHYFGIYEKVFKEAGVPDEIKYLSLVESSLNPHLISTSGAVGPWQFMYGTAKLYDLDMNSNIDERKDAYASTYAVTQYLKEAYNQFDDWLIALASYNCGRGCVARAITRSGIESPTFWELSPYLPQETRNYIPKYIAMTYVLSNAEFHDIRPVSTELDMPNTLMMVDKTVDLANIAHAVGVSLTVLKTYNPAFKKNRIEASIDNPVRLLLPQTSNINDSLLYVALNSLTPLAQGEPDKDNGPADIIRHSVPQRYKVKPGETLATVSRKFDVSVQNLRAWNNLSSKSPIVGRSLIVEKAIDNKLAKNVGTASKKKSTTNVMLYTVKSGDSLERIANRHKGVTVAQLKSDNNLKGSLIKPGMKLKVNLR